jgi:uncharacterized protein YndB with AHSA1/START domain
MTDLIERELELSASPAEVWVALTDPSWLQTWLADEVALEPRPGGDARFTIRGRDRAGWVEEATPPAADHRGAGRLAFWWAEDDAPASRVELALTATETGTLLRVTETRPLNVLELIGTPLPGHNGSRTFGPALVAA